MLLACRNRLSVGILSRSKPVTVCPSAGNYVAGEAWQHYLQFKAHICLVMSGATPHKWVWCLFPMISANLFSLRLLWEGRQQTTIRRLCWCWNDMSLLDWHCQTLHADLQFSSKSWTIVLRATYQYVVLLPNAGRQRRHHQSDVQIQLNQVLPMPKILTGADGCRAVLF